MKKTLIVDDIVELAGLPLEKVRSYKPLSAIHCTLTRCSNGLVRKVGTDILEPQP